MNAKLRANYPVYLVCLLYPVLLRPRTRHPTKTISADRVMDNIRQAFERSGMTLTELGEGLGYAGPTARKLLVPVYRTPDPRISTVLLIAETLDVRMGDRVKA